MAEEILIKILDKTSMNDQIRVYADAFGYADDTLFLKRYWENKHYKNPIGNSTIIGAYIAQELAGINAYMPMKYSYKGKILNVVQSCESGVANKFRRRGIWRKIVEYAIEYFKKQGEYEAIIGFPNYKNSFPGFIKMGWEEMFYIKNMLLINNGSAVLGTRMPKLFSWIGKMAELQKVPINIKFGRKEYRIEQVGYLNPSDIDSDRIILSLSEEWLKWEIDYKNMKLYKVSNQNKVLAGFIVEVGKVENMKYLKLVKGFDYCKNKKEYQEAFISFIKYLFENRNYAFLRIWTTDKRKLKKLGFIHMKSHLNPFVVYPLKEEKKEIMVNPDNWNVGMLDLD